MHENMHKIEEEGACMRTTLDLPEDLVAHAMKITRAKTKKELVTRALENLVQKEQSKIVKKYHGKVDLDIDLDALRKR